MSNKEKFEAALGLNMPTLNDIVGSRNDYDSEENYLWAVADMAAKMENPAVRNALRKASVERVETDEKAERERQREEYKRIRSNIQLDQNDRARIDAEAATRAKKDLAAGKIVYSELGQAIEKHGKELENKRKDEKAAKKQFNDFLRANIKKGSIQ